MTIVKQWRLLLLIAGGQLICLTLGVFWFSGWLQRSVMDGARIQILQSNQAFAHFLSDRIDATQAEDLEPGSLAWQRVQKIIETLQLPNEGFACIADNATGRLLCHPEWRTDPQLKTTTLGDVRLLGVDGCKTLGELFQNARSLKSGPEFSGYAELEDGTHLIAAVQLAECSATLLLHQRERTLRAAVKDLLSPVKSIGFGVATLITLLGLSVNSLILQKYEDRLADSNKRLEQLVNIRTKSLIKTRNAIIYGLAKLAESRDTDTGEHLDRIRQYVIILAEHLAKQYRSINQEFISNLALASSLHDIGKVGIPDAVLLKRGRLDERERRVIEQHPLIGGNCLAAIQEQLGSDDFLEMARMIADSHHERWDGAGYPHGLSGEDIPLVARIVALADVYDALTTKRPYKEAMSHAKAKEIIVAGRGSHFDPQVVDAFLAQHEKFAEVASSHGGQGSDGGCEAKLPAISNMNAMLQQSAPQAT